MTTRSRKPFFILLSTLTLALSGCDEAPTDDLDADIEAGGGKTDDISDQCSDTEGEEARTCLRDANDELLKAVHGGVEPFALSFEPYRTGATSWCHSSAVRTEKDEDDNDDNSLACQVAAEVGLGEVVTQYFGRGPGPRLGEKLQLWVDHCNDAEDLDVDACVEKAFTPASKGEDPPESEETDDRDDNDRDTADAPVTKMVKGSKLACIAIQPLFARLGGKADDEAAKEKLQHDASRQCMMQLMLGFVGRLAEPE